MLYQPSANNTIPIFSGTLHQNIDEWSSQKRRNLPSILTVFVAVLAALIVGLAIHAYQFVAWGNDWDLAFAPAGRAWLMGENPYQAAPFYASPPWGLFVIAPLSWVHPALAMFFPAAALCGLAYTRRKLYLIPMVGLSVPFLLTTVYANIDWLVMVGVAMGGSIGAILNTLKPQAGIAAILGELAKRDTWRSRMVLLIPLGAVVLVTAPLWIDWLHSMSAVGQGQMRSITALYPRWLGWAIAVPALWLTIQRKSAIWGCVASLALAPYWQLHSLLPITYLVAEHSWRGGLAFSVMIWIFALSVISGVIPLVL